jgi:glycolate oxidase iron-sulfur subunit
VEYGAILELARDRIETAKPQRAKSVLLESTTRPLVLKAQLLAGRLLPGHRIPRALSHWVAHAEPEADRPVPQREVPLPELTGDDLPPVKGEVYFLEGCAMRVLFPRVHAATRRLLRRVGYTVREVPQGCCGALHAHNGHLAEAAKLGEALITAMPGNIPVIVNSAGCGSTMKEYGPLLGDHGEIFSRRVLDISEFLLREGLIDRLSASAGVPTRVSYHDACHLAHGQRITKAPRQLIKAIPNAEFVELIEADTCCGSAGIYNVTEPVLARSLLDRKWRNIATSGATVLVSGNPGCHSWIAQAAREHGSAVNVLHTAELLEASFIGLEPFAP